MRRNQSHAVVRRDAPGPRITGHGLALAAFWVLPVALSLIVVADVIGWAVARAFGLGCFGLVCLIG